MREIALSEKGETDYHTQEMLSDDGWPRKSATY